MAEGKPPKPNFEDGVRNQAVLEAWEKARAHAPVGEGLAYLMGSTHRARQVGGLQGSPK